MEKSDLNYIRNFIIEGNIRRALEELLNILGQDTRRQKQLRDDVILLRTQFNEVERKENLNLITSDEANHDRAHLQKAILDVINDLEETMRSPAVAIPPSVPPSGGLSGKVLFRVIPLVLAALLIVLGVVFRKQLFGPGTSPGASTSGTPPTTRDDSNDSGGMPAGGEASEPADLAVDNWQFHPDPPVQKENTRITCTVRNTGQTAAGGFKVEWWASVNAPQAANTWTVAGLAPGESKELIFAYPGYASSYSSLQTRIVVDPEHAVEESNRTNNESVRTISVRRKDDNVSRPDLVVTGLSLDPNPPTEGQPTLVAITLLNSGNARAQNIVVQWWASVNAPQAAKTWTDIRLEPGASTRLTYTYAGYPSWYASLQTKAVADPNRQIDDKDRSNNAFPLTISVKKSITASTGKADLSVSDLRFTPETPVQNQAARVDFIVENKGDKAAENVSVQWWAGVNYPQAEKTWTGVTIAAGERKKFSFTYAGYPSWYGSIQTKVVADPNQRIDDKNRSDNVLVRTISVSRNIPAAAGQADLVASDLRFTPATPVQNQATRVDVTIENKGTKAAENVSVQWWASIHAPQPAKTWTGITIGPGERKNVSFNYSGYPSWYGQLQTKIVVDPGNQVNDANRSNNEKTLTIRVLKPN